MTMPRSKSPKSRWWLSVVHLSNSLLLLVLSRPFFLENILPTIKVPDDNCLLEILRISSWSTAFDQQTAVLFEITSLAQLANCFCRNSKGREDYFHGLQIGANNLIGTNPPIANCFFLQSNITIIYFQSEMFGQRWLMIIPRRLATAWPLFSSASRWRCKMTNPSAVLLSPPFVSFPVALCPKCCFHKSSMAE